MGVASAHVFAGGTSAARSSSRARMSGPLVWALQASFAEVTLGFQGLAAESLGMAGAGGARHLGRAVAGMTGRPSWIGQNIPRPGRRSLLIHALPVRPRVMARLVAVLGRAGFGLAYGAVSVAAHSWLIGPVVWP
jgi:hypothetical protein